MKPLWLLDVDGVLNALNSSTELHRKGAGGQHWPDFCEGVADGYNIVWSPTLVERISDLHNDGHVEVRWLTTWEERAQTEIAPMLGLPHFELAGKRMYEGPGWWKFPIAQRAVGEERPFIWTDDDLMADTGVVEWMQRRWQHGDAKGLVIAPQWYLGISPKQLTLIEAFISEASCV